MQLVSKKQQQVFALMIHNEEHLGTSVRKLCVIK